MEYLIETRNLKTYFEVPAGFLHAVDGVDLKIKKGTTLGVVGESGCGKSTLGRTILHLEPVTAGQIWYNGEDITHASKRKVHQLRMDMQMIFQDPYSSLDPRMNITRIIEEPLKIYKKGGAAERRERVEELMNLVGLAPRLASSYPHELDGGRRQRIGIARALALNPKLIICDEPVSALDVSIQAQILNLLQDIQEERGLTYVFVTHDLSVVRHISTDICVMYCGKIVETCPTKELFAHPRHPYTSALLQAIPSHNLDVKKEIQVIHGEVMSPINPPRACRFAPRCPMAEERCFHCEPELRDLGDGHMCACFKAQ